LLKVRQTALLLLTGICAYTLTGGAHLDLLESLWMTAALLFAISGCTALNMLIDRDIDAKMERTADRPLPAGRLRPTDVLLFGGLLSATGLALAFALNATFGSIIVLGFILDLWVYSFWLKRRTPLSIIFGGVSGGMPVLAGRTLALGRVDLVGVLLSASILLWIPSHILTLAIRYSEDYRRAGVPMWPIVYGPHATRTAIAGANVLNALALTSAGLLLKVHPAALAVLLAMSLAMFALSAQQLIDPTEQRNWLLFKAASLYMLASSLLLTAGALAQ
jgi:protoheme IX farnesyltransferase